MEKNDKIIMIGLVIMIVLMAIIYTETTIERTGPTFYNVVGADTVAHMGAVRSIRNGNPPWQDQYYLGDNIPRAYSWLWHATMAYTPIPVMFLLTWSPLFFWILSLLAIFYAGKILFGKNYGFLLAAFYMFIMDKSIINPNPKNWLMGLFLLATAFTWRACKSKEWKHIILAGLTIGILFMTYSMMIAWFIIPLILITFLFLQKEATWKDIIKIATIPTIALIISSIYWMPILTGLNATSAQSVNISSSIEQYEGTAFGKRIWEATGEWFAGNWYFIPLAGLAILGLYNRKDKRIWIFISMYIAFFAGSMHDYITRPLLGWSGVQPFYFPEYIHWTYLILTVLGATYLLDMIAERLTSGNYKDTIVYSLAVILLVSSSLAPTYNYLAVGPDSWKDFIELSYKPMEPWITMPAEWINKNTKPTDVIVAHPMYAYMMFGMTGRPIYSAMYGHMLSFTDDDYRRVDVRTIYETDDITEALELLRKENAAYLMTDPYALQNQWFQDHYWEVILKERQVPITKVNVDKFKDNDHFKKMMDFGGGFVIYKIEY